MSFWKRWWSKRAEPKQEPVVEEAGTEPMGEPSEASPAEPEVSFAAGSLSHLLPELKRLDRLLEQAVAAARAVYGTKAAADPFRGLHISQSEVEHLLARAPGVPILRTHPELEETLPEAALEGSRLDWLKQTFRLTPFEVDVIRLTLAPELDLRYERIYAYLQDDVTRRRPSVDLALNLLSPNPEAKLANRVHFAPEAALIRQNLIHLIADPQQIHPPLLSHYLKLDEQITRLLLRHENLDPRLASFCDLVAQPGGMDDLPLGEDLKRALPALLRQARETPQPLRLYFHGPKGTGKRRVAAALAAKAGARLLVVDLPRALTVKTEFEQMVKVIFREAWSQDAILYLDGLDALRGDEHVIPYQRLLDAIAEDAGVTILAGKQPWIPGGRGPLGIITVPFSTPDFALRRSCWKAYLSSSGITLDDSSVDALADRFRLTSSQIAEAVATACNSASLRAASQPYYASPPMESPSNIPSPLTGEGGGEPEIALLSFPEPTPSDLFGAARAQSGHDLTALARKIEPKYTWNDIVLPDDARTQLREVCQRVAYRHRVLDEWGFDRKLSLGKGVNALFAGPSGTGKTMAAEVISNELGLDLYKIDLSAVVSKYIGETEKNLERVFTAAENANAILFFDEADALFGKRSEVKDAHDRYANIEIAYLLQKMEQYDGLAILATNLRQNMDEAFIRRLQFIVEFPFPDESHRHQIWQVHFPPEAPHEQIDFDFLAKQFRFSGGNIKNIVLGAAFLSAANGGKIDMEHLIRATKREYQKMGRVPSESEFGRYAEVVH